MSKRKAKGLTPTGKAELAFMADCRKKHPKFDNDVAEFGLFVAIYNAGWLTGDTHRRNKTKRK